MIGRVSNTSKCFVRRISASSRISQSSKKLEGKKFSNPEEFLEKKQMEQLEDMAFQQSLREKEAKYTPQTLSSTEINPVSKRPTPLNVELLKYTPLTLPKTHGHEVASIKFRGYDEKNLTRAAEFALRAGYYLGIPCSNIVPLKTEKRLYTVIKSPFAQAKSKENFHRVTYNKEIRAYDATSEVVDLWLSFINKYALDDVKYEVMFHIRESLDFSKSLDALQPSDLSLPKAYQDIEDPIAQKVAELLKSETFKQHLEEQNDSIDKK